MLLHGKTIKINRSKVPTDFLTWILLLIDGAKVGYFDHHAIIL